MLVWECVWVLLDEFTLSYSQIILQIIVTIDS